MSQKKDDGLCKTNEMTLIEEEVDAKLRWFAGEDV
jgi:hypothetical protein